MLQHGDEEFRVGELCLGVVADNVDPEGLGRVRVEIPGVIEPKSDWAPPVGGSGGGAKERGWYDVPDIGAMVGVLFYAGDIDHPYYLGGWSGRGETPSYLAGISPVERIKIKVYETARFLMVFDHRSGSEALLLKDKTTGDLIQISADKLHIKATAKVLVEAPVVNIGADELVPLTDGVVKARGIDTLTGATYGALGSASSTIMVKD